MRVEAGSESLDYDVERRSRGQRLKERELET